MKRIAEIIEDIVCIILLVILPDFILEKFGIYDAMYQIMYAREAENEF